jgi:hypothetical protein
MKAKELVDKIKAKSDIITLTHKETGQKFSISFVTYVKGFDGDHYVELHLYPGGVTSKTNSVRVDEVRKYYKVAICASKSEVRRHIKQYQESQSSARNNL